MLPAIVRDSTQVAMAPQITSKPMRIQRFAQAEADDTRAGHAVLRNAASSTTTEVSSLQSNALAPGTRHLPGQRSPTLPRSDHDRVVLFWRRHGCLPPKFAASRLFYQGRASQLYPGLAVKLPLCSI